MRGELVITSRHLKTGRCKEILRTPNMVLDLMYEQLINLISGGDVLAYVNEMQYGTGTLAPAVDQTFLQKPITPTKSVSAVVDAPNFTVTFTATLGATEANGFPIAEAGLLTAGDVLVARATFASQSKTSDYAFDFTWTITLKS